MGTLALAMSAVIAVVAAQSPFVGSWKLNPSKSQFTGMTVTYELLPSGETQVTAEGQTYKFRTDGKEYPAIFGITTAWKQIDANTWEATNKIKDTVLSNDTIRLSADGKMLTVNSKGKTPSGTPFSDTTEFTRVSGGPGLSGKWRSSKVNISSPETVEIGPYGTDGIAWRIPEYKASVDLKFDGKDYPAVGPTVPANFTLSATMSGPRSFDLVEKANGKIVYRGKYTISDDGRTLTAVFSPEGTTDKVTAVYDRR